MKTEKGTELPILKLPSGKEYLEVKYRVVWFREVKPDWSIETEFLQLQPEYSLAKAMIKDSLGRVIATGHKFETKGGFADHMEKAETGAIGRALALCGFGTANTADEFNEGDRIVDSPVAPLNVSFSTPQPAQSPEKFFISAEELMLRDPGSFKIKHRCRDTGKMLSEVDIFQLDKDVRYWEERAKKETLRGMVADFVKCGNAFLKSRDVSEKDEMPDFSNEPWPEVPPIEQETDMPPPYVKSIRKPRST